jgi:hypothetical protein
MMRHWLAGAAAFAMMTGVAFADDASTTTRSVTTSTVPAIGGYKSSEIHRDIDRDRNATHMRKTYHSNANGSIVTRTRTAMPDGSRTMSREKETVPFSGSSIEKKTTTTIDR